MWNNIKRIDDELENVAKFVYTKDNGVAESVLYRYPTYEERTVICCSTQSGCPMGCRFCGAGDYFVRNLTKEEIVDQVDYSIAQTGISASNMKKLQVMFMSMGEPLLNLKALIPAMYMLYEKYPHAKLLISTSGPRIPEQQWDELFKASKDILTVGLQFSVHETSNEARDKLVPFKNKMGLGEMSDWGIRWWGTVNEGKPRNEFRKPFFNYCAHEKNTSDEDARLLASMYNPYFYNATVSVICERNDGMPATNKFQQKLAIDFAEKLVNNGFDTRVFDPAGQDTIGGGCGQLWFVQDWMEQNPDKARPSAGHGKAQVHVPVLHG